MARDHIALIKQRYSNPPTVFATAPDDLVRNYLSKVIDPEAFHGKRILEIGAGCSQYARVFLDYGCSAYIANDLMPDRLVASRISDPRYQELPGDFLSVPTQAKSVDVVFANLTMMMVVPLFRPFAKKIAQVLKPGGLFMSMDSNYFCPLSLVRRFTDLKPNPVRLFSPRSYARLFENEGLVTERLLPFTARLSWTTGNWVLGTCFWLRARKA